MTPVFAHFGHWYVSLPVYFGPVAALILWIKVSAWRERRSTDRDRAARKR